MRYRAEVGNTVIEVVAAVTGHYVTKTVNGDLHDSTVELDEDYCIDLAINWTRYAVEEARENRTGRLQAEEKLAK